MTFSVASQNYLTHLIGINSLSVRHIAFCKSYTCDFIVLTEDTAVILCLRMGGDQRNLA